MGAGERHFGANLRPVRASIVIPAFNQYQLTVDCLEALRANTPEEHELILVDNGSVDATRLLDQADVTIRNRTNRGFAAACNQGALLATGEFVVFLNNDTLPRPGWLGALLAVFERDSQAGIAGARLEYPDGRIQHAGVHLIMQNGEFSPRNRLFEQPAGYVEAVTGACMAVRASLFRWLRGFDEDYWNGFEDVDLCMRARAANRRVWYAPESRVVHLESQSGPERWTEIRHNVIRFHTLWAGRELKV